MIIDDINYKIKNIKHHTFGISIPELRKLAKQIAKNDYVTFLTVNPLNTFELQLLHAFVIGYAKDDINILLNYFGLFIPYVQHWAVCDSLCQSFLIARKYPDVVLSFLSKYITSQKEFESRIVSVILLSHYLTDDYIDDVFVILNKLDSSKYYSRMGVAWALATIMAKYPEKCLQYLKSEKNNLDLKTFNKTLQKIKESYRVSDEIKQIVKSMKKTV